MRIGVLGGGQLGRMMALAGYPLGLSFSFYDASPTCSAAALGPCFGSPDPAQEAQTLQAFIDSADVFTYEFENIPVRWVETIAAQKPVFPGVTSLATSQNRLNEKRLFESLNIPTAAYRAVHDRDDLVAAVQALGLPVVVKTVTDGYDGKGQFLLRRSEDIDTCWQTLGGRPLIAEEFVAFKRELSVIAVRGPDGDTRTYPLAENHHHRGILSHSFVPAPQLDQNIQLMAERYMASLMQAMNHIGVLTLELFETRHGLVANETAPRVHNSGHWSIEGAACSQFENHVRAVAGLPLGDTRALRPTAMVNVIGQHPRTADVLRLPETHLHVYGKAERPDRKLGHITLIADTPPELNSRLAKLADVLPNPMALSPAR